MQNGAQAHAARYTPPMDSFPRQQCGREVVTRWPLWCVLERGHDDACSLRRKWWKP